MDHTVRRRYERGFVRDFAEVGALAYDNLGWDDAAVAKLAWALTYAHEHGLLRRVKRLSLMRNKVGDEGCEALATLLAAGAMPKLKARAVALGFNPASKKAQASVTAALWDPDRG